MTALKAKYNSLSSIQKVYFLRATKSFLIEVLIIILTLHWFGWQGGVIVFLLLWSMNIKDSIAKIEVASMIEAIGRSNLFGSMFR